MLVKYVHLERFGTDAVDGINIGECHIFPKIDGTNASIWWEEGSIMCGSRNRELTLDADNAGFMSWATQQNNLIDLVNSYKGYRFYGEWLVPHSLKTYREDAWRKFYIFDVVDEKGEFLHYNEYVPLLETHGVDYIPCVWKITNPTYESLKRAVENNKYLLQENTGLGEGIVVKQYGYKNKFGRTTWAKLITNTFKDAHIKEMGGTVLSLKLLEEEITKEFIHDAMVEKIIAKIRNENGVFGSKDIPRLLSSAYHDLVTEELWEVLKKHKNPKIDFKTLYTCTITQVKKLKPELFGV